MEKTDAEKSPRVEKWKAVGASALKRTQPRNHTRRLRPLVPDSGLRKATPSLLCGWTTSLADLRMVMGSPSGENPSSRRRPRTRTPNTERVVTLQRFGSGGSQDQEPRKEEEET